MQSAPASSRNVLGSLARLGAQPGLWAAAVAVLAQRLVHGAWYEAPFAPYSIAEWAIRLSPGPMATWAIEHLGHLALPAFGYSVIAVTLILGALLGRRSPAVFGSLAFLLTLLAARLDPMDRDPFPTLLSALTAGLAASLTIVILQSRDREEAQDGTYAAEPDVSRRKMLAGLALGTMFIVAGGGAFVRRLIEAMPGGPVRADEPVRLPVDTTFREVTGISPRITPNSDHYTVDIDLENPLVGEGSWRLKVKGSVESEQSFTLDELRDMETSEHLINMQCISNTIGGPLTGNSRWTGVPAAQLLALAKPSREARFAIAKSEDGYTDVIAIDALTSGEALIIFGMNGVVLPRDHGFPARLIYPGHYGMRSVKWLVELELIDDEEEGYWAERGWDKEALVRTGSRLDVPDGGASVTSPFVVGGIAWAGDRGVSKVEVSTDGGASWQPAQLEVELSTLSWRRWQMPIDLPAGDHKLTVRATDGTGQVQDEERRAPHPSGASGYQSIDIAVTQPPEENGGG